MGLLHIYYGDGKGKTTAAWGLALRSAGAGMRVLVLQFLKGNATSELLSVKRIPEIEVVRCDRNYGFTFQMTSQDKRDIRECHNCMLRYAKDKIEKQEIDLVILDEWNGAYASGLMDQELAKELVLNRPSQVEMVLTGRNPADIFLEAADYASEILAVKHPYEKGIAARKGIEY